MPRDGGVDTDLGDSGRAVTHAPRRLQHLFEIDQRMPELAGEVTDHGDLLIQVRVVPGLLLVHVGDEGDDHQYWCGRARGGELIEHEAVPVLEVGGGDLLALGEVVPRDRKSTRLNSSHVAISYAVFCLKKKKKHKKKRMT